MSKQSRCSPSNGLQRTWVFNLVSWYKYILFSKKKCWSLVFLTYNVSFAWWFCVYFFEQAWEVRGSYPLKAVTGTTTALLAHLAKALWLAKASLQTLTTSFVLNVPRKNLWPIQLSHKIWQKSSLTYLHNFLILK